MGNKGVVVGIAQLAEAVGGGAAGVQKGDLKATTQHPEGAGILEIECIEDGGIHFRRVGAGAQVDHGVHLAVMTLQPADKIIAVHLAPQLLVVDIRLLVGPGEIIHRQHIGIAHFVQFLNHAGADKACCAGDHDHGVCWLIKMGRKGQKYCLGRITLRRKNPTACQHLP